MKLHMKLFSLFLFSNLTFAEGFVSGVPTSIQKTDFLELHLLYVSFEQPVSMDNHCDSSAGVVILDSNESSEASLSLAMTALASGKKFGCFIRTNDTSHCSAISGAPTTFPVCAHYPTLSN